MGKHLQQSLKKEIEELKERETFIRKLRDHNSFLLRVMAYMNVIVALFQVWQKHYFFAATNVLVLVICLEIILYNYRKREKNCRKQVEISIEHYEKTANIFKEMDKKMEELQDTFKQDMIEMEDLLDSNMNC